MYIVYRKGRKVNEGSTPLMETGMRRCRTISYKRYGVFYVCAPDED